MSTSHLEKYEPVIGLEVHVQLATQTKIFASSSAQFGLAPNGATDPVVLGLPGSLPVLNKTAVQMAVRLGLAVGGHIRPVSRFSRKHYFYPDSPKGYQISQFDEPYCEGGVVRFRFNGVNHSVPLTRIHMEEDAGKNIHGDGGVSWVDFNRAGVPLCEVVSEPALRSSDEAAEYLRALRMLIRYLGLRDGYMEEGSMRCDANVSIRLRGATKLGTRAELKNINSFKNVKEAIDNEIRRQAGILDRGEVVVQETRLWDAEKGRSQSMRSKEEAHDYRYFPEPDLPPLHVDEAWRTSALASLPELPEQRFTRYTTELGLSPQDAGVLINEREISDYFDAVIGKSPAQGVGKKAANWVVNEVLARVADPRALGEPQLPVPPDALSELMGLIESGTLSGKLAKEVFGRMWTESRRAGDIVAKESVAQVSDESVIEAACKQAIEANPKEAERYRAGDKKLVGFFVGQVMKMTDGKANPKSVNQILAKLLS